MIAIIKDNTTAHILIAFGIFLAICAVVFGIIAVRRYKLLKQLFGPK